MITSANHQHRNPNWIFCTVDGMIGVTSGGMNVVHIEWFLREMPIPGNRQKNSLMSQYSHSSQIWVFIRKTFFRGQNIEFILQLSLWPKAFGNDSKVGIIAKKMFFLTGIFTQITNTWSVLKSVANLVDLFGRPVKFVKRVSLTLLRKEIFSPVRKNCLGPPGLRMLHGQLSDYVVMSTATFLSDSVRYISLSR